eukprot:m.297198 g.297198  ORF g.297198 m.297198 type:complete len:198 (-) comp13558_c0_seq1:143-736(-)
MALREIKLCLLGDAGVGKSSIVTRFVSDSFNPHLESTIGASFMSKTITVDGKSFKYQIWDTAGQEKYRGLAPMYYRGAAAAIIVYDITDSRTFTTLKKWVAELRQMGPQELVLAIAGNKCDLPNRQVDRDDAEEYAESIDALFVETSALTSKNIASLFENISRKLPLDLLRVPPPRIGVDIAQPQAQPERRRWCSLL